MRAQSPLEGKRRGFVSRRFHSSEQISRSMAEFSVKFRIKWDGRYIAGVSKISELRRSMEVTQHREGRDPSSRKSSGQIAFSPAALKCG